MILEYPMLVQQFSSFLFGLFPLRTNAIIESPEARALQERDAYLFLKIVFNVCLLYHDPEFFRAALMKWASTWAFHLLHNESAWSGITEEMPALPRENFSSGEAAIKYVQFGKLCFWHKSNQLLCSISSPPTKWSKFVGHMKCTKPNI